MSSHQESTVHTSETETTSCIMSSHHDSAAHTSKTETTSTRETTKERRERQKRNLIQFVKKGQAQRKRNLDILIGAYPPWHKQKEEKPINYEDFEPALKQVLKENEKRKENLINYIKRKYEIKNFNICAFMELSPPSYLWIKFSLFGFNNQPNKTLRCKQTITCMKDYKNLENQVITTISKQNQAVRKKY